MYDEDEKIEEVLGHLGLTVNERRKTPFSEIEVNPTQEDKDFMDTLAKMYNDSLEVLKRYGAES